MSCNPNVYCDQCQDEIGTTKYASEYYLSLAPISKRNDTRECYATDKRPQIDTQKDFCNIKCLEEWIGNNFL